MAVSAEGRPPFDLASEMKSVSVRAVIEKNGIIIMFAMDQYNCNEVIAFLSCNVRAGKVQCSDRNNRTVFTSDCGIQFQNKRTLSLWVNQSEEKVPHSWRVEYLQNDRWMADKTALGDNDSNHQFMIDSYKLPSDAYWVYTVTNKLNEEVCIMRGERAKFNITYFQSMEDEVKLLLLAFSAKRLYIDFNLNRMTLPKIVISRKSPNATFQNRQDEKDFTITDADAVEHPSLDISALVVVIFHRAGYNKALGIQYYDLFDRNTGITQLTFEVSLKDKRNFTAVLKDCNGTAIMTASQLLTKFTVTLMSKETFNFETFKTFNVYLPRFYDSNSNIFLAVSRIRNQTSGRGMLRKYIFFHPENNEDGKNYEATVFSRGSNSLYAVFNNPMMDARRKGLILAFAVRSGIMNYSSHTVAMPPIEYCYRRNC